MARPMKPLVKSGGYYPSNRWIPLVYPGGYTTMQGEGGEPTPSVVWVTVSGSSPLALANAAASNIRSLVQYGKCVQNGTPTPDAPVDIVCNNGVLQFGKPFTLDPTRYYAYIGTNNTWSYSSDSYSIVIPVTVGKKYKITADPTTPIDGSVVNVILRCGFVDTVYDNWKQTAVYPSSTSVTIYDWIRSTPQDTQSVEVTASHPFMVIQMGKGAFASNIANGRIGVAVQEVYPDGTPEVLSVGGKNAFNADITSGRSISAQGAVTITPSRSATENGVPIIGGEEYILSYAETFRNGVFFYDADDVFVSYLAWGNAPRAFTAPSDARFVRFSFYEATPPTNVQLELGSTATTYEPYRAPQTATVVNLFAVGDYRDEVDIISGAITRRVGITVLTGDEELSTTTVGYYRFVSTEHIPSALAVCTHLVGVSSGSIPATADREGTVWLGSNWIGLGLRTRFATVADLKAYLAEQYAAGTPVIVLYPLAEEITESVTPQPLHSYNGTNVVEAATNVDPVNLSVEYAQPESGGS